MVYTFYFGAQYDRHFYHILYQALVRVHKVHKTHVSTYQIVQLKYNWYEARDYCKQFGGFLATIDDIAEHDYLRSQLM